NYFAAADRLSNPGIGLTQPFVNIPQRADFTDRFWQDRTAEYVRLLERTDDPANPKRKLYDSLIAELTPAWKRASADRAAQAKEAEAKRKEMESRVAELKKKAGKDGKDGKDGKGDKEADPAVKDAEQALSYWSAESQRLKALADKTTPDSLREEWRTNQAYAHA